MRWFKRYSPDHNEIMYTSRQCNYRGVCKISLWSVEHILNRFGCFNSFSKWNIVKVGRVIIDKCIQYEIHQFRTWLQNRQHCSMWQDFTKTLHCKPSNVFGNHLILESIAKFISSTTILCLISRDPRRDRDQSGLILWNKGVVMCL